MLSSRHIDATDAEHVDTLDLYKPVDTAIQSNFQLRYELTIAIPQEYINKEPDFSLLADTF